MEKKETKLTVKKTNWSNKKTKVEEVNEIVSGQIVVINNIEFTLRKDVTAKKWVGCIRKEPVTAGFDTAEELFEYLKTPKWDVIMIMSCMCAEYVIGQIKEKQSNK